MTTRDSLKYQINENNGIITVAEAGALGISKPGFYSYAEKNGMERVSHGIYADNTLLVDDLYVLSLRCRGLVFSHETALFLHNLTDREPISVTVTVKTGYNPSRLKADGIQVYTIKPDLIDLGKTVIKTQFGNEVPVYDLERTICDIIRSRSKVEAQELQSALKQYVSRRDKDLNKLMDYAAKIRIEGVVRRYMEVLL